MSFLDPKTLQSLIRHLESTDVDEADIEHNGSRVRLRREPGLVSGVILAPSAVTTATSNSIAVTSPLTGMFYSRPSPDQPQFAAVGDRIEPGHVVALVETMKLFNEVVSDVGGTITSVVATDGALVEAGQPLVYVDPTADEDNA